MPESTTEKNGRRPVVSSTRHHAKVGATNSAGGDGAETVGVRDGTLTGGGLKVVKPRTIKEGLARLTEEQRRGHIHHVADADHFVDEKCSMCDTAGYPMERRIEDARHGALELVVRRFGRLLSAGACLEAELDAVTPVPSARSERAAAKRETFDLVVLAEAVRLTAAGALVKLSPLVDGLGEPSHRVGSAIRRLYASGRLEGSGHGSTRTYAVARGRDKRRDGVEVVSPGGRYPNTVR